eukprot:g16441.t1
MSCSTSIRPGGRAPGGQLLRARRRAVTSPGGGVGPQLQLHLPHYTSSTTAATSYQRRFFANRLRWETDTEHAEQLERFGKDPVAIFSYCHAKREDLRSRDWLAALTLLTTQQDKFDKAAGSCRQTQTASSNESGSGIFVGEGACSSATAFPSSSTFSSSPSSGDSSHNTPFAIFNEDLLNFGVTKKNVVLILHRYAVLRYAPAIWRILRTGWLVEGGILYLTSKQLALVAWSLGKVHICWDKVWDLIATRMGMLLDGQEREMEDAGANVNVNEQENHQEGSHHRLPPATTLCDLAMLMWGFAAVERREVQDVDLVKRAVAKHLEACGLLAESRAGAAVVRPSPVKGSCRTPDADRNLASMLSPRFLHSGSKPAASPRSAEEESSSADLADAADMSRANSAGKNGDTAASMNTSAHSLTLLLRSFCIVSPADVAFLVKLVSATTRALEDPSIHFSAHAVATLFETAAVLLTNRHFFPTRCRVELQETRDGPSGCKPSDTGSSTALTSASTSRKKDNFFPRDHRRLASDLVARRIARRSHLLSQFVNAVCERSRRLRLDVCFNQDHIIKMLRAMEVFQKFAGKKHDVALEFVESRERERGGGGPTVREFEMGGAEQEREFIGTDDEEECVGEARGRVQRGQQENVVEELQLPPLLTPAHLAADPRVIYQILAFLGGGAASPGPPRSPSAHVGSAHLRPEGLREITKAFGRLGWRDVQTWKRLAVRLQKTGAELSVRDLKQVLAGFRNTGRSNSRVEGVVAAYLEVRGDREAYGPC